MRHLLLLTALFLPLNAIAANNDKNTLPYTFKEGDTARAASVNENFAYLLERIKLAEIKIDSLVNATKIHDDSISQSVRNSQLPIGTIIGSMLNPADFKTNFPGNASLWKLADSSSVSGELYESITGNSNLPDLRGVFLRGLNYDKKTDDMSMVDPDTRVAGSFQYDAFGLHSHKIAASSGNTDAQLNDANATGFAGWRNAFAGYTSGENSVNIPGKLFIEKSGGAETRPKNVAVYWYIKVK